MKNEFDSDRYFMDEISLNKEWQAGGSNSEPGMGLGQFRELLSCLIDESEFTPEQQVQFQNALSQSVHLRTVYFDVIQLHCALKVLGSKTTSLQPAHIKSAADRCGIGHVESPEIRLDKNPESAKSSSTILSLPYNFEKSVLKRAAVWVSAFLAGGLLWCAMQQRSNDGGLSRCTIDEMEIWVNPVNYEQGVVRIIATEVAKFNGLGVLTDGLPIGCWISPMELALESGKVVLVFDQGAELILIGPAELEVISSDCG
jgi:hypothetical protein